MGLGDQFIINIMSDSEQEGFHRPPETYFLKLIQINQSRASKIKNHNINLFKSPTSIFYQSPLYEYPRPLDHLDITPHLTPHTHLTPTPKDIPSDDEEQQFQNILLLSEYFPIKFSCLYNRFDENLLIKRDTTIIIRNIERRIQNDQLTTFHQRTLPDKHNHHALLFSSDFEAGNLHSVFKSRKNSYYYLLLQNDINTHGYNNWFHFNIRANNEGQYKFVIVNLSKKIHFSEQLSLLVYTSKNKAYERNLKFQCFQSQFKHFQSQKVYWSIKFQYKFIDKEDVYFSLMPPYSYSKLSKLLKTISQPFYQYKMVSIQAIYKTNIGNIVSAVRISNRQKSGKKAIIITARQHPCETVGSFICQQIIKLLISQTKIAKELLQKFSFYIIPMVNPDGVIHGNARTNILGYDINRSWNMKSINKTEESQNIWNYFLSNIYNETEISWLLDLHGHSKILGFCSYFSQNNEESQIMAYYLKNNCQYFDQRRSIFGISKDKTHSLRVQAHKELNIRQSITVETSLYGYRNTENKLIQYDLSHFRQISLSLMKSLLETQQIKRRPNKKQQILQQLKQKQERNALQQLKLRLLRQTQSKQLLDNTKQIDSDSNPQEDYLLKEQRNYQQLNNELIALQHRNSLTKSQNRSRNKTYMSPQHDKELIKSKSYYNQSREERLYRSKLKSGQKNSQTANYFYRRNKSYISVYSRMKSQSDKNGQMKSKQTQRPIEPSRFLTDDGKKSMTGQDQPRLPSKQKEQRQLRKKSGYLTSSSGKQEEKTKRIMNKSIKLGLKTILYPTSITNLGIQLQRTNLMVKRQLKQARRSLLPYSIQKMLVQQRIKRKISKDEE